MRKLVVKGGAIEQEYPLIDTTIIGRASSSNIRLEGQKVADEHAKISKTGPNIFVEDLDTPHGITVNGKKVARWALKKGDLIGVGAITLLYDEDDKPDPVPKPKAPPIPEVLKSAANLTPVKAVSAGKSKDSLPAVKNGNGNGNGAHGKSAAALPAAKPKDSIKPPDSKAAEKPAEAKAAVPKPVEPKPAAGPAIPSAKSSSLMAAVLKPGGSGRQNSANSSQSLNAVAVPSNFNSGNSSRINIGAEKQGAGGTGNSGMSSPRMNAIGAGAGAGAGNSKSGILSAAGGKFRPGLSSQLQIPGSPGNTSDSSSRNPAMNAASSAALIAQRMSSSSQAIQPEAASNSKLPPPKVLMIAVGVLVFIVLLMGAILIATLSRGNGPTSDEKAAILRLQAKGPKASDDLRLVTQRLRAIRQVSDVHEILGEPDIKTTGEITLWEPQSGTIKYPGPGFIAYYISDQGEPSAIEENPVANILLFMVDNTKVEFMGPRKYARFPTGPEKKVETHTTEGGESQPVQENPSPASLKNNALPLPPALPLPEDKPPTAPKQ